MQNKKAGLKKAAVFVVLSCLLFSSFTAFANSSVLKKGLQGNEVVRLQNDLKTLGFFSAGSTGYYGDITVLAVKKLQKKYGLKQDGIAGSATLGLIDKLLGKTVAKAAIATESRDGSAQSDSGVTSRGSQDRYGYLIPWFGGVENIFARGKKAEVLDVETGLSFNIMRTYGSNHADCETLTWKDTAIMKSIYGGQWSWTRRAIIVTVDGIRIAASMAGMPHAGDDSLKGDIYVKWRSGGYGYGVNLDKVKNNDMDGHFDIHFLGSKTHTSDVVDKAHQDAVKKAAAWAENNF